ncbi:class I SAM-dependent methyltransferase [Actinocrispum wychmicini]|uniref:class I SAM-dependent methyltransferase n=1 Tax=Actinocrispum wychmicini TaxID=1213861 RepID=UPI001A9D4BD3|nr:class I SAM-dependent methyltransferase [Actinocrispum wychmicini]
MDESASADGAWGTFLGPDPALAGIENPHDQLGIKILSGHQADRGSFAGRNAIFDGIAAAVAAADVAYEDQCTAQHYFDIFGCVERFHRGAGEQPRSGLRGLLRGRGSGRDTQPGPAKASVSRVVDVGVFMGGSASVFAGCVEPMGVELDLVDTNQAYLQFTYERLRRTFPRAASRVRMFYGDLPTYVRNVLCAEEGVRSLVHHDGAHDFGQVVKDLASLYFVRDRVHGVAIQDTHLRSSNVEFFTFVDSAVHAVFGGDVTYEPLGSRYDADNSMMMNPNPYEGNYFLAGQPEGMYIELSRNEFRYPHPAMSLDAFLPAQARVPV